MISSIRVAHLGLALVGVVALVGCARPVEVPPPTPEARTAEVCRAFTEELPADLPTVGERREATPDSPFTAAYGDPPVAVRCGVAEPTSLSPTSLLVTIDDLDWLPEQLTAGWRMTSVGRAANVEITVPVEQGPAPAVASDLGPVVVATIPER